MKHEGLKRLKPTINENDENPKRRRQGVKVREDFDDDDLGDDRDDNSQKAHLSNVSDDENLS